MFLFVWSTTPAIGGFVSPITTLTAKGLFYVSRDRGERRQVAWFSTGRITLQTPTAQTHRATGRNGLACWAVARSDGANRCDLYRSFDDGQTWEPEHLLATPWSRYLPSVVGRYATCGVHEEFSAPSS